MPPEESIQTLHVRAGAMRDMVTIAAYHIRLALETEQRRLDPYSVSAGVRATLEDPAKGMYLVAEIGERVIGYAMLTREWSDWRNGDVWWIQTVYVHESFRRQGVCRALFDESARLARQAGAVMLRLHIDAANASARAAYDKLGFAAIPFSVMEKQVPKD